MAQPSEGGGYYHNGNDRRSPRSVKRPARATMGRRKGDIDPDTLLSRKAIVTIIVIVDLIYLVGEALLFGRDIAP